MTNYILIQYPKYISIFIALLTVISFFLLFERHMEKRENTYDDILREKYPKLEQLKALRWSPFYCEASPPKLRLDGASAVRFRGFSFFLMTDFLLSPYDLSLSSSH